MARAPEPVIVASGAVGPFGRFSDRSLPDLARPVLAATLEQAGVGAEDIEQAFVGNAFGGTLQGQESVLAQILLKTAGIEGVPVHTVKNACSSGSDAVHLAWSAVAYGQADCVLALGAEKLTHKDRRATFAALATATDRVPAAEGRSVFMDVNAERTERYMAAHGATPRHFALCAAKNRAHAALNPRAAVREPIDVEAILADKVVVAPLTRAMCGGIADGAAAVLLVSPAFARSRGLGGPRLAASAVVSGRSGDGPNATARAGKRAYEQAGLGPSEVSVAEVHDPTAPQEMFDIEDLGLAERGGAIAMVEAGETSLGGRAAGQHVGRADQPRPSGRRHRRGADRRDRGAADRPGRAPPGRRCEGRAGADGGRPARQRFRGRDRPHPDPLAGKTMPRDDSYSIPAAYKLYIGNEWVAPNGDAVLESRSPLTGELLCTVPDADEVDVATAVLSAKGAVREWSGMGARKRANLMLKIANRLIEDIERFAWLETTDTGKPWRESVANVHTAADRLRYFAGAVRAFEGHTLPVGKHIMSMDFREPLGVVGIMGAWNFPLNMFAGKIAPAIAVGNTVVYKAPEPTPLTTLELAALIGDILPAGVVNVISGAGETAGQALVAHPDIRKISLTGSSATGRVVMADAAKSLKKVTLELGGKNAQIVYGDADMDAAAQGVMLGAFMNQGQVCTAGSRIFAHRPVAGELVDRIVALIPRLRIGDPFARETTMGTMVYRGHYDSVLGYIEQGRAEGGEIVSGGSPMHLDAFPEGLFVEPTLFAGVEDDMTVAREEIFGPVATVHVFDDEDEAVGRANALDYGLAAGIWTEDLGRAHRTAQAVEAGRVWVNCYNLFPSGAAFGGVKASGYGREDAFESMLDFTQTKNVIMDYAPVRRSFYD